MAGGKRAPEAELRENAADRAIKMGDDWLAEFALEPLGGGLNEPRAGADEETTRKAAERRRLAHPRVNSGRGPRSA